MDRNISDVVVILEALKVRRDKGDNTKSKSTIQTNVARNDGSAISEAPSTSSPPPPAPGCEEIAETSFISSQPHGSPPASAVPPAPKPILATPSERCSAEFTMEHIIDSHKPLESTPVLTLLREVFCQCRLVKYRAEDLFFSSSPPAPTSLSSALLNDRFRPSREVWRFANEIEQHLTEISHVLDRTVCFESNHPMNCRSSHPDTQPPPPLSPSPQSPTPSRFGSGDHNLDPSTISLYVPLQSSSGYGGQGGNGGGGEAQSEKQDSTNPIVAGNNKRSLTLNPFPPENWFVVDIEIPKRHSVP